MSGVIPHKHTNEHHHSSDITTGGHDQIQPDQYPLISQYILDVNRIGCFKKLTSSYILSTSFKKMFNNSTQIQRWPKQCHRPTNPMEHWCMTDSDPGLTSDSAKSQQKKWIWKRRGWEIWRTGSLPTLIKTITCTIKLRVQIGDLTNKKKV